MLFSHPGYYISYVMILLIHIITPYLKIYVISRLYACQNMCD